MKYQNAGIYEAIWVANYKDYTYTKNNYLSKSDFGAMYNGWGVPTVKTGSMNVRHHTLYCKVMRSAKTRLSGHKELLAFNISLTYIPQSFTGGFGSGY